MFTGIITDLGKVKAISFGPTTRLEIATAYGTGGIALGASVACNGCCLSVVEKGAGWMAFEASRETLDKTTMADWKVGHPINLERALKLGDELGGHLVSGHVDGVGRILSIKPDGGSLRMVIEAPAEMARNTGAVVLLKGVPTIIAGPTGEQLVTATGTPVLATAGSGDVLGGIIVTLLAQGGDALSAAGCGAWMHGRAAEIANAGRPVRGVTLADVMEAIGHAWRLDAAAPTAPVLVELPAVGDRPATGVPVA
jgi:riboflavin synthase